MKRGVTTLLGMLFMSLSVLSFAQNRADAEGIQFFEGTWDEALQKAAAENKPIFLDVYASWCAPCKLLKNNTFPDVEVGRYFNNQYINVSLDGEKGDGVQVAHDLNVQAYPSLFILNSSGEPLVYFAGFLKSGDFIELGKAGIEQLNKK
ncbi:MAG: hypothetical protein A2W85_05410 [Bacteroidetes bacterium GWF2_41_31]|nr:MAG: hypothetical protein A2W85_05410 [Bacteroidetes bacterium GWF2_41_31]